MTLETGRIALSAEDYHADRSAVSKSWLDQIERSPAHLRAYLDGEKRETPALILGHLTHSAVLEPDLLDDLFAVTPKDINRRTNAGKAEYAEWKAANAHKTIVTVEQLDAAKAMRDSVYRHKAAKALLGKGDPEQTVVWVNPETGEKCKARADKLLENVIVDVKSTTDARPREFARSIVNYRYDVQAYHYEDGFDIDRFAFIAVESQPPYAVAVYAVDDVIRQRGRNARDKNLRTYAECKASNHWPGYDDVIRMIELPRWALTGA